MWVGLKLNVIFGNYLHSFEMAQLQMCSILLKIQKNYKYENYFKLSQQNFGDKFPTIKNQLVKKIPTCIRPHENCQFTVKSARDFTFIFGNCMCLFGTYLQEKLIVSQLIPGLFQPMAQSA